MLSQQFQIELRKSPSRERPLEFKVPINSSTIPGSSEDKRLIRGPPPAPPSTADRKFEFDIWEALNNTKIVLAFDAPGVDLTSMEIVIVGKASFLLFELKNEGFMVKITRRMGSFEEKHLANNYKATRRTRYAPDKLLVTDEVKLPYLVRPDVKKAFHHHGTVYLTLEKFEVSMFTVNSSDWQEQPSF
jgi:HSP20 family molecular chaperone IbpA